MPSLPTTWPEFAALCVVLAALVSLGMIFLRAKLQSDFATKANAADLEKLSVDVSTKADKTDIAGLSARLSAVEDRLSAVPSHDDFRHLAGRVGAVERQVDVVAANVKSVGEGVGRSENMLRLLLENALKGKDLTA